jgi:uncharacterized protein involved in type VI secretion and phage assembly
MDEIAAKQVTKSETGDNRIIGVVIGTVAQNYSQQMPGRVCVQIPMRDSEANELRWARVAMPSSGNSWGHYFLPEVGDQVLLAFEQGSIEKPYVVGCVPKDSTPFMKESAGSRYAPENSLKRIATKNGSAIEFTDGSDSSGLTDKISIHTADGKHVVELNNEKGYIEISDKENANHIRIETEQGAIKIDAGNMLKISVGESIRLTMNGSSGSVALSCTKLKVDASSSAKMETSGRMSLSGGNVMVDASSVLKAASSGLASIGGSPVKIG